MDQVVNYVEIFAAGVKDATSVHKTIPLLVNRQEILINVLRILGANVVLLLGSVLIFEKGISPGLDIIKRRMDQFDNSIESHFADHVVYLLYHAVWVIPIYLLCYVCSSLWYQDLADHTYRYVKGLQKNTDIKKSVAESFYATMVWVFIFLEVQVLVNMIPVICNIISSYIAQHGIPVLSIIGKLFELVGSVSLAAGLVVMSALYAWYGFDCHWIASDISPDKRFDVIHNHWLYFVGFGAPYVVLMRSCSFFVGYGLFLALFPVSIMLGAVSDFKEPYLGAKEVKQVKLFDFAKKAALFSIKRVDKLFKKGESSSKPKVSKDVKVSRGKSE